MGCKGRIHIVGVFPIGELIGTIVLTLCGAKRQWYHRDSKAIINKLLEDRLNGSTKKSNTKIPDVSYYFPLTDRYLLVYDKVKDCQLRLFIRAGEFLVL